MDDQPLGDGQVPQATSVVLRALRDSEGATRADLAGLTQLPRSTVSHTVRQLLAAGTIEEYQHATSTGGRRPSLLRVVRNAGPVWTAELGEHHALTGVVTLDGEVLASRSTRVELSAGADAILEHVHAQWTDLASGIGAPLAVGLAVPGPVGIDGCITGAARMPGWNGLDVAGLLSHTCGVPCVVENDARAASVGEWAVRGEQDDSSIYVKAGHGIGANWISSGRWHRGSLGFAGDITHARIHTSDPLPCSCGNKGCLETVGSGAAILGRLASEGSSIATSAELVEAARNGDPRVTALVREAGGRIGEVLSGLVNFLNPDRIVIGGAMSQMDALLAGVRSELYDRCLPMSTGQLVIEPTRAGAVAPLIGMSILTRDLVNSSGKVP